MTLSGSVWRVARVAAVLVFAATNAHAVMDIGDPYGDEDSVAWFGSDDWGQWIGWARMSDPENCLWYYVGDTTELWDMMQIWGYGGNDQLLEVPAQGLTVCGYPMRPLVHTNNVYLRGGDGKDILRTVTASTYLLGGNDNDILYSAAANAYMEGNEGDDMLINEAPNAASMLLGGEGNDCMGFGGSGAPMVFDCGGGEDTVLTYFTPSNPQNCETSAPLCPGWEHLGG